MNELRSHALLLFHAPRRSAPVPPLLAGSADPTRRANLQILQSRCAPLKHHVADSLGPLVLVVALQIFAQTEFASTMYLPHRWPMPGDGLA